VADSLSLADQESPLVPRLGLSKWVLRVRFIRTFKARITLRTNCMILMDYFVHLCGKADCITYN